MLNPDVYCATRLLTLYEVSPLSLSLIMINSVQLVSRPEDNHWVLHGRGGLDLIKHRGPSNHTTEFDWMLLKSQGLFLVIHITTLALG